jgi:hypothetical protein
VQMPFDVSLSEKGYRHREYAEPVPFFGQALKGFACGFAAHRV